MSAVHNGALLSPQLIRQPGGKITFPRDGSAHAQETFECAYRDVFNLAPLRYISQHPIFPSLLADEISIEEQPGQVALVSVIFKGLNSTKGDSLPPAEISIDCSCSDSPIDTHPDFKTLIGGFPDPAKMKLGQGSQGLNGAQFDEKGKFTGFPAHYTDDPDPTIKESKYAGVTVYYKGHVMFTRSFASEKKPNDYTDPGKIVSAPLGAPEIIGNWLLLTRKAQQQGAYFSVQEQFSSSGNNGWDDVIYKKKS